MAWVWEEGNNLPWLPFHTYKAIDPSGPGSINQRLCSCSAIKFHFVLQFIHHCFIVPPNKTVEGGGESQKCGIEFATSASNHTAEARSERNWFIIFMVWLFFFWFFKNYLKPDCNKSQGHQCQQQPQPLPTVADTVNSASANVFVTLTTITNVPTLSVAQPLVGPECKGVGGQPGIPLLAQHCSTPPIAFRNQSCYEIIRHGWH